MPTSYGNLGENKGGDPNILKLEATTKVRPLDNSVAEYRQHTIKDPNDPEKITMVVCPGPRTCPLCRKPADPKGEPYFPVSRRYAACVWDFGSNTPKVLIAGPQVFEEFKTAAKLGIPPDSCDWTITKTGQGISTKYQVVRHNAEPGPQVTPDMLLDIAKYEAPDSPERIFNVLEKYGIDYDSLPIPEFTLDEALAFVMPYTTHKGLTIEKLLETDSSFAEWLHGTKLEQGALGDPVFIALQMAMQERSMVAPLEEALASLPEPAVQEAPAAEAPAATSLPEPGPGEIQLIAPNGLPVNVPATNRDSLLAAGFTEPVPIEPEPEANAASEPGENDPVEVVVNGATVTMPYSAAKTLVDAGAAEFPAVQEEQQPEPAAEAAPEPPKLPGPGDIVKVDVNGAMVDLPFASAEPLVIAGSGKFVDPGVAQAFQNEQDKGDRDGVAVQAAQEQANPAAIPSTAEASDEPFMCPHCNKGYKTKGGLTQHVNREHPGAPTPAQSSGAAVPSAPAAASPADAAPAAADTGATALLDRVKDKIARAPFARDYDKMLEIFQEETNISNIKHMNEAQLTKLEVRIDKEIAAAG